MKVDKNDEGDFVSDENPPPPLQTHAYNPPVLGPSLCKQSPRDRNSLHWRDLDDYDVLKLEAVLKRLKRILISTAIACFETLFLRLVIRALG